MTMAENREDVMVDDTLARRRFLLGAGIAGTAVATGLASTAPAEAQGPPVPQATSPTPAPVTQPEPEILLALTASEAAFVSAAVDTFVPADELSPSGTDCGSSLSSTASSQARGAAAPKCTAAVRFKRANRAGLSIALTPRSSFRRHRRSQRVVTQNLRQDFDRLSARSGCGVKDDGRRQG